MNLISGESELVLKVGEHLIPGHRWRGQLAVVVRAVGGVGPAPLHREARK